MATHRLYIAGGTSATGPTGHEALCTTNAIAGPATPPVGINTAINIPLILLALYKRLHH